MSTRCWHVRLFACFINYTTHRISNEFYIGNLR
jgi:hypothetical protein